MKRDLDLCREIMLAFEALSPGPVNTIGLATKVDAAIAIAHIDLLVEAKLLEGECYPNSRSAGGGGFVIQGITWAGHDFIDTARSEKVWNKTKSRLKKAGSWSFGLLVEVLKDEAKRQLGGLLP